MVVLSRSRHRQNNCPRGWRGREKLKWFFSPIRGIIYSFIFRGDYHMSLKTNAARILDQNKMPYELKEYAVDESDLSAISVAQKVGLPIEQVYKTLVARGDKTGVIVVCIQGDRELNLKSLASISGNKKVEVVSLKEVQPLTGYIRGGVSPLGMKKHYPVFIDSNINNHEKISVSAGLRGLQLYLSPLNLISVTKAQLGAISKQGDSSPV